MNFFKVYTVTSEVGNTTHSWNVMATNEESAKGIYLAMNPGAVITSVRQVTRKPSLDQLKAGVKKFTFTADELN